jgi:hypothetical protein
MQVINNCVVVENGTRENATEKKISVKNQKARSIAFFHTAFIKQPKVMQKSIGEYLVVYKNGKQVKVALIENWNITDVRSMMGVRSNSWSFTRNPDILIGSRLAWRGITETGLPLNAQILLWNNPYPQDEIDSIEVSVTNDAPGTKIAVLGITLIP